MNVSVCVWREGGGGGTCMHTSNIWLVNIGVWRINMLFKREAYAQTSVGQIGAFPEARIGISHLLHYREIKFP